MTIKKEDILNNLKKTAIDSEGKRLINMYLHLVNEGSKNDKYSRLLRNYKSNFPETKYSDFIQEALPKNIPQPILHIHLVQEKLV